MEKIANFSVSIDKTKKERHAYFKLTYHYAEKFPDIHESMKILVREKYDEKIEFISNIDSVFEEKYQEKIIREGFMPFLACSFSTEGIFSKGLSIDKIEEIIKRFLRYLKFTESFLIIDPYFFCSNTPDEDYNIFLRCIPENVNGIKKIVVISNGKNKNNSKEIFKEKIDTRFRGVEMTHHESDDFHDRFWINTINKTGVLIGTSLNGIGKKISVIDKLSQSDVEGIIEEVIVRFPGALRPVMP